MMRILTDKRAEMMVRKLEERGPDHLLCGLAGRIAGMATAPCDVTLRNGMG